MSGALSVKRKKFDRKGAFKIIFYIFLRFFEKSWKQAVYKPKKT